ncbi:MULTISPECIES: HAMP domain-containing sensor histidine kinase [unclassified Streptococcus]|uniref:sensor histidine kinase n=1 Tax=unclassified Streptococcus TaxID=2608887 RepID=UPI001071A8B7|nr:MULTISPECIES: sensor histidine kinase [unclassified Streptococcus]MBF0805222.1 sensor histidine kinase [Streptococcus sp. 19428wA2_WM07]TFU29260.1 HAMP domain-containing histidine kinase [Streptococcus sp. WM07]
MIRSFLREYRVFFFAYFLLASSFLILFYLYQLPWPFFLQSIFLSCTIFMILMLSLFWKFFHRIKALQDGIHDVDLHILNKPIDRAYLMLLEKEKNEARQELLSYKKREEDLQAVIKLWSHQMKVPLAALSLMTQTKQLDPQGVDNQLLRLDNYQANLLNYLKLSNQSSDFRFEEVEVRQVMVDLVKKYRTHFLHKQIAVSIEGEWKLKSDRKWLSFALSQILDNAIKYSQERGSVQIQLDEGVRISDQGIGILPEDIPRLFDQGFTGFNGREHQKASGFGLYLAKRVLDQLELAIEVTSQVDQGTQVVVRRKEDWT